MKMRTRAALKWFRVWLDDLHDWLRPRRKSARLPLASRRYAGQFHDWPSIYLTENGEFHILAPHHEPHVAIWIAFAGLCVLAIAVTAVWLWRKVNPAASVGLGLVALPLLPLLLRLTSRHLEIVVTPDGMVLRREAGGALYLLLKNYDDPHEVMAGRHGLAQIESERRQRAEMHLAEVRKWHGTIGGKDAQAVHALPPMPAGRPRYGEATEVCFLFGHNHASWTRVAEIDADTDRKALRLRGAIEFVIEKSRAERSRRRP